MNARIRLMLEGGFHNSEAIAVVIKAPERAIEMAAKGEYLKGLINDYASAGQLKKLDKHFCGMEGCRCGGWLRARVWIK